MKINWPRKKIIEVCEIKPAKSEARRKLKGTDLVSFVPMEDLGTFTKDFIPNKEKRMSDVSASYTYFANGDVLMAKITPCFENGKIGIAKDLKNGIGFGSSEFFVLRPKTEILSEYLYYLLLSDDFRQTGQKVMTGAVGHKRVPKEFIENYVIELPPIIEQKRLIKILGDVFERISKTKENAEKNLQNSKELFESYLQSVFAEPNNDWLRKRLGDVCKTGAGGTPLKSHKDYYQDGTIPWLRSGEVDKKEITESELYITKKGFENSSARLFPINTVLIAMYGATAGQVGILRFESTTNQAVCGILPNKDFIPEFIYYFFSAKKADLINQAVGGAQPNISQIKIKNTTIPVPSLSIQKSIVKKLDDLSGEVKKVGEIYKQKLADLEELKKSILKKTFSGELSTVKTSIAISKPILATDISVPSPYIRNQVHSAIIDQVSRDGGWTTEVAVAKYDHLLQEVFGLPLGYEFETHQFGPFDSKIKRLLSSGLNGNKWFTKRNGMIVFGTNIRGLLFRQSNLYRKAQSLMRELSGLGVTKLEAEKVELLSTVCHSIKKTDSVALNKVRDFMSQWKTDNNRTKAEKFSSEQTEKCLDFIVRNNLHQRLLQTT